MMHRVLFCAALLTIVGVMLAGCESEEVHKQKFMATCTRSEFSAAQCEVLYSVKRSAESAEQAALLGVVMGAANAGGGGGRR